MTAAWIKTNDPSKGNLIYEISVNDDGGMSYTTLNRIYSNINGLVYRAPDANTFRWWVNLFWFVPFITQYRLLSSRFIRRKRLFGQRKANWYERSYSLDRGTIWLYHFTSPRDIPVSSTSFRAELLVPKNWPYFESKWDSCRWTMLSLWTKDRQHFFYVPDDESFLVSLRSQKKMWYGAEIYQINANTRRPSYRALVSSCLCFSTDLVNGFFVPGPNDTWHHDMVYEPVYDQSKFLAIFLCDSCSSGQFILHTASRGVSAVFLR